MKNDLKYVVNLEQFYELEEKIVNTIREKLTLSHRELNKKVDHHYLNKIFKQKGLMDSAHNNIDDPFLSSSNENSQRNDLAKGLLSKRKVDVCGSCERPVVNHTETAEDKMQILNKKQISNKRVFVSCNLSNNIMNQTMELQTKNLQMPLYQSQDDRIKLKISKRPKGIQYVNHIDKDDNDKN